MNRNTRWEPVSARRRPSGHDDYGSVADREREEPSTPNLETSAVADQRQIGETTGGGEELKAEGDEDTKTGIRCRTTTNREEVNAGIGSTTNEGWNTMHTIQACIWRSHNE